MAKERAKKLIKKISEISKKKGCKRIPPIGRLMREVGYSKSYSRTPYKLKGTETWQELMGIFLSDSKIAKVHSELLKSSSIQHYIFPKIKEKGRQLKNGKMKYATHFLDNKIIKEIVESVPGCKLIYVKKDDYAGSIAFFQAPDNRSRKDALDMAYKLGGKYAPDKVEIIKRKYQGMSNAELAARIKDIKNFLLKK